MSTVRLTSGSRERGPPGAMLVSLAAALMVLAVGVPAQAVTVLISTATTCDNYYDLYVDGQWQLGTTYPGNGWNTPEAWSVPLAAGQEHVVAVKGSNLEPYSGYNPAGFLGEIEPDPGNWFAGEDLSHTHLIVSDSQWKIYYVGHNSADPPPIDTQGLNWTQAQYDDSGWLSAFEIGPNGRSPWGTVSGIDGSAKWIWTENWDGTGSIDLLPDTPVYFRRTFTPVPEPVTMAGLMLGIGSIAGYVRRRRRTA